MRRPRVNIERRVRAHPGDSRWMDYLGARVEEDTEAKSSWGIDRVQPGWDEGTCPVRPKVPEAVRVRSAARKAEALTLLASFRAV